MKTPSASRSPEARRARAIVRDYFAAVIATQDAGDLLNLSIAEQRFASADRALGTLKGYAKSESEIVCCTPGHEADCMLSADEKCECACGGHNHGTFSNPDQSYDNLMAE